MHEQATRLRLIGFLGSLVLTLTAYFIMVEPGSFRLTATHAIAAILTLAVIQAIVQLLCFVDIWDEGGPQWNVGVFISTVGIVLIIVLFSIWIINNLNSNMMS